MSRITDQLDGAGAQDDTPRRAPRAVVATDATDAEAVWHALAAGGSLDMAARASGPGGVRGLHVPVTSHDAADDTHVPEGALMGSYRAHPVFVPDMPAGRVLLHALRLLEEDALSDVTESARKDLCAAALGHALAEEARGVAFDARLSEDAVGAFLARTPGASAADEQLPPRSTLPPVDALLVLDAAQGAVVTTHGGLPLVVTRADRPALLAVASGEHSHSAHILVRVLVTVLDLGQGLQSALAGLPAEDAALAMLLDERGVFQAAGTGGTEVHVQGYERAEAS
ncbi:MAG: hypothetical protein H6726_01200 [Sandaracinaceae bacterium]|nr:hypothetical protein [Sandaracinaceae bacterium]